MEDRETMTTQPTNIMGYSHKEIILPMRGNIFIMDEYIWFTCDQNKEKEPQQLINYDVTTNSWHGERVSGFYSLIGKFNL